MVEYLKDKYPGKKFIGVGFSLGANILLKYKRPGDRPIINLSVKERKYNITSPLSIYSQFNPSMLGW